MDIEKMIEHLGSLITSYLELAQRSNGRLANSSDMRDARVLTNRLEAAIERITPAGSIYRKQLETVGNHNALHLRLSGLAGIATALRDDFNDGWRESVVETIHAETYSDYLEMADGLLSQSYKDAAAVIAGTSLEVHVRALCVKNGIDIELSDGTPKKADTMNVDLKRANVYDGLRQKHITAWMDLRNKAAHGDYTAYEAPQVRLLIEGVRDFMMKYPA